ncbi:unnamed protein product, partial [Symbiodinium sp. CCMP2592]
MRLHFVNPPLRQDADVRCIVALVELHPRCARQGCSGYQAMGYNNEPVVLQRPWVLPPKAAPLLYKPPPLAELELSPGIVVRIGTSTCEITEALGMGSFGVVWAAKCNKEPCQEVAVKEMICRSSADFQRAEYEIALLKELSAIVPSCPLRIPSYVASDSKPLADGTTRVRLAMSRLPGIPLDTYVAEPPEVENRLRTAVAFARALVEQLAPTMASLSSVAYHRDVNAHNILVDVDAAGIPTHSLVDFGLAVNASTWMDPSPKNPGGKSEWEFLDVGGDCRYWPVSAWRQFEAGCRALSEAPALCAEYQTHLDLQGLGLTVLQVLVAMLPEEGLVLRELRTLQDAWTQYWDDATEFWSALLNTFRHGGDWSVLKQEFVARGVHRIMAQRLKKLHDALNTALSAAAAANLDEEGTSDWPHGSAGLLWALLAMVSYGEERTEPAHWGEVTMRL